MISFPKCCLPALVLAAAMAPVGAWAEGAESVAENETIGGLSFEEEIQLTVVNLSAYVTDKKGEPVVGLTEEDFRVFQDGQERRITHFQFFSEEMFRSIDEAAADEIPSALPEAEGPASPPPEVVAQPVYIVLYVDNENLRPLDRNRVLSRASEFVRENLRPPVRMMVLTHEKSVKVAQAFTEDRELVQRALRAQRKKTGGRAVADQEHKRLLDALRRDEQDSGKTSVNTRRNVFGQIQALADEEANQLLFSLHGIRQAVTMLSGLPGRKTVIYISNGLPMVPGIDLWYAYANAYDDTAALTRMSRYDQTREFESLASAANSQEVSFYTIGAGGLAGPSIGSVDHAGPQDVIASGIGDDTFNDSLRFMADSTGGRAIVNTNDFSRAFDRVAADLFTYYSLGYTLNSSGGDKVHRVKIDLPDHPEYEVRFRRLFVEKSLETKVQEKVMTNLIAPVEENPLHLETFVGDPTPAGEERWTVPIDVSFPLKLVALLPEGEEYVGRVVLYVSARDAKGGQSDLVRQLHEVRLKASEYENLKGERWRISAHLLMNPGSYTVSVGLMDRITNQAAFLSVGARGVGRVEIK